MCERECLCLWIRPHKESSFVSSKCYLCSERHFSFVFTQEASGQKPPPKTQKHFSPSHTQMCANSQRRPKPKHTNTQLSAQTASGVEWGIIMQCVKNKLKISGECSSLSDCTENTVQGKLVGRGGCMVVSGGAHRKDGDSFSERQHAQERRWNGAVCSLCMYVCACVCV